MAYHLDIVIIMLDYDLKVKCCIFMEKKYLLTICSGSVCQNL